jgi:hypothetical protein
MLSSLTLNHVVITLTIGRNELKRRVYRRKRCCGEGGGGVLGGVMQLFRAAEWKGQQIGQKIFL